jgi:hypothetical protein
MQLSPSDGVTAAVLLAVKGAEKSARSASGGLISYIRAERRNVAVITVAR